MPVSQEKQPGHFTVSTISDFNSLLQEWLIFTKKDLTVLDYMNNKPGLFLEFNLRN